MEGGSRSLPRAARAASHPKIHYTGFSISTQGRHLFGDRETSLALHVSNVLNQIWYDPGFNGLDVPAIGRTVFLTVVQSS